MKFKSQANQVFAIEVNDDEKVLAIKQKLLRKINEKIDDFLLVFKNTILEDSRFIADYAIKPDEIVLIVAKIDYLASVLVKDIDRCHSKFPRKSSNPILYLYQSGTLRDPSQDGEKYMKLKCANFQYAAISHKIDGSTDGAWCKQMIGTKIHIPSKSIHLFGDVELRHEISDSHKFPTKENAPPDETDVFYTITADVDNLIKREFLGNGCFGKMWRCSEIETNRELALKKFEITLAQAENFAKLNCELDVLCAIGDHPNIVKFIKVIQKKSATYLVTEYMAGGSLTALIRRIGALPDQQIRRFSGQIAGALHFLHGKRIVHRHIKSNNVLLDADGNAKLGDFGLAKVMTDIASTDLLNGVTQSFVGTANYMAPEVMNGEPYGTCADIWSLGATLVEMVTGQPPYHGLSVFQVLTKISVGKTIEYARPKSMDPALQRFISRCLEPNPRKRPPVGVLLEHDFLASAGGAP